MDMAFRFPGGIAVDFNPDVPSNTLQLDLSRATFGSSKSSFNGPLEPRHERTQSELDQRHPWNTTIDNLDFLNFVNGNATLVVSLPDGSFSSIQGLDVNIIAERCPLLAFSFEAGELGLPRASIEGQSRSSVICFLRFLYTGDYLEGIDKPSRCSLLVHAQLCFMAGLFEVPELQVVAHANVIQETEMSCSRPTPPEDLCETIRFIFDKLSDQQPLIDTILHYCVFCFLYHGLGKNEDFKRLTFEHESFTRQLCRTSFYRGFDDEGAIDIVRLQTCEKPPQLQNKAALGDFLFEMHGVDSFSDIEGHMRSQRKPKEKATTESTYNLAHRPKQVDFSDESGDEEKGPFGFTLVHRPKAKRDWVDCGLDAESSSSDLDTDVDVGRAPANYKDEDKCWGTKSKSRGRSIDKNKEEEQEDLESSFLTIKPPARRTEAKPERDEKEGTSNEGGYNSDSDWSLV